VAWRSHSGDGEVDLRKALEMLWMSLNIRLCHSLSGCRSLKEITNFCPHFNFDGTAQNLPFTPFFFST